MDQPATRDHSDHIITPDWFQAYVVARMAIDRDCHVRTSVIYATPGALAARYPAADLAGVAKAGPAVNTTDLRAVKLA